MIALFRNCDRPFCCPLDALAAEKDSLAQEVCKLRDELAERQVISRVVLWIVTF
jgi:hypothetical protein